MYRFDSIEDLQTMKNVCMFIRIYNDLNQKGKSVQETAIRDHIKNNYGKDIPLFDIFELKRMACEIVGSTEKVPSITELDDIIDAYIKSVKNDSLALYKEFKEVDNDFKTKEYKTYSGDGYTASEMKALEPTIRSKFHAMKLMLYVAPILFGVCILAGTYGVLNYLKSPILEGSLWSQITSVYAPAFCSGWLFMLLIVELSIRKSYKAIYPVYVLIDRYSWTVARLSEKLDEKRANYDSYIESMQFVNLVDGKFEGSDKLSYYLRIDNTFADKPVGDDNYRNKKFVKKLEKADRVARVQDVKKMGTEALKIDGWSLMSSSSIEKKNCNKDLVSRISLLTESLKKNKETDSHQYSELVDIYCGDLSSDSRDKYIVRENDQVRMYNYYLSMVEKLEPYEKFIKDNFGVDYDSERFAERTATEDEKQFILNYIWYLIETELKRVNYIEKFKQKVYDMYANIKMTEIGKIINRVDLYKLYFNFLNDFEQLIVK